MSTEHADQYPEVSGEDAAIVPPQGARPEWPKKIRTLTASELDRLTIDGYGRFYWDGKLVNYQSQSRPVEAQQPVEVPVVAQQPVEEQGPAEASEPGEMPQAVEEPVPVEHQAPVDPEQHAMDLLDRAARELAGPVSAPAGSVEPVASAPTVESEEAPTAESMDAPTAESAAADNRTDPAVAAMAAALAAAVAEPRRDTITPAAPQLTATPGDQLAPAAPAAAATAVAAPAPIVMRPQELSFAPRSETVRVKLTALQSLGLFAIILGLLVGAAGIAASGFVAVHDFGCKAGLFESYCPKPPPAPAPPPRVDIPA